MINRVCQLATDLDMLVCEGMAEQVARNAGMQGLQGGFNVEGRILSFKYRHSCQTILIEEGPTIYLPGYKSRQYSTKIIPGPCLPGGLFALLREQ